MKIVLSTCVLGIFFFLYPMSAIDSYTANKVRQFKHWGVYVHPNQGYLGRCILWCDRADALDLTDATREERTELFEILPQLKQTIESAFGAEWMNYSFLGNETRHLHGHVVPRYSGVREFSGVIFDDPEWGANWRTDKDFETSVEVLEAVKKELQNHWK